MKDEIRIEGLQVYAHHGVFAGENEVGQTFIVNALLYTDTHKAGRTDCLEDSTHYGEVCHFITKVMTEQTYKLIEKAAEEVARGVLRNYPLVNGIDLEIKKPQAPIGLPFESVSVKIQRKWHQVYVAFGSNMGDKKNHIENGLKALKEHKDIRVKECSQYRITKPYGGVEQEDFLNGVLCLETYLNPFELLDFLHEVEKSENRERILRWGPRTLDLDILFFDDLILDTKELIIPHADMANRSFVLEPLAEIAPYKRHPLSRMTVKEMLDRLNLS